MFKQIREDASRVGFKGISREQIMWLIENAEATELFIGGTISYSDFTERVRRKE